MNDPALMASRQTARRDFGLLNRAYRRAKMRGDFGKALEYAKMGDTMGLPVGRPAPMEEIEGVGDYRLGRDRSIAGSNTSVPSFAPVPRTGYLQGGQQQGVATPMTLTKPQQSAPVLPSMEGGQTSGGYAATQPQEIPNNGGTGISMDFRPDRDGGGVSQTMEYRYDRDGPSQTIQLADDDSPLAGSGYMQGNGAQGPPTPMRFAQRPQASLLPPARIGDMTGSAPSPQTGYNLAPRETRVGANRFRGNQLMDAKGNTNQGMVGEPGVFDQRKPSPIRPVADGGEGSAAYPSVHNVDQRAAFSRAWQTARTDSQRAQLVQRAQSLGIPMNNAASPYLAKSQPAPSPAVQPESPRVRYLDTPEGKAALAGNLAQVRRSFAQTAAASSSAGRSVGPMTEQIGSEIAQQNAIQDEAARAAAESSDRTRRFVDAGREFGYDLGRRALASGKAYSDREKVFALKRAAEEKRIADMRAADRARPFSVRGWLPDGPNVSLPPAISGGVIPRKAPVMRKTP